MPHEFSHLPLTYFQTLVERTFQRNEQLEVGDEPTRNESDEDGLKDVDVDALIRKGGLKGFSTT